MAKLNSFEDLFFCFLSDMYFMENRTVDLISHLVKKADSPKLKEALQDHLAQTKNQIKRLDRIFKLTNQEPCKVDWAADENRLISDVDPFIKANPASPLLDAAIIAIAQRVEHMEIATYGTLKAYADVLKNDEIKSLLDESLKEEYAADEKLTKIAQGGVFTSGVNVSATHL